MPTASYITGIVEQKKYVNKNSENNESMNKCERLLNSLGFSPRSDCMIFLKYLLWICSDALFYQYSLTSILLSESNLSANCFLKSILSPTDRGPR